MIDTTRREIGFWEPLIAFLFTLCYAAILAVNLIFHGLKYSRRKTFLLENWQLLIVGAVLLVILSFLLIRFSDTGEDPVNIRKNTRLLVILSLILFLAQLTVFYFGFFVTDWDAGGKVLTNSIRLSNHAADQLDNMYYSHYPNNIFLTWVFAMIIRAGHWVGIESRMQVAYLLTVVQCVLNILTGMVLFRTIRMQTRSYAASWLGWIFYVLLLGTSCWSMIPYSDGMILIVPILMVRLYQMMDNGKFLFLKWAGISLLAYWGYHIKPQAFILFIAIVIISVLRRICLNEEKKKKILLSAGGIFLTALVFAGSEFGYRMLAASTEFDLNPEERLGMAHFFMMGLNPSSHGVWAEEDVDFSEDIHSNAERDAADLQRAMDRLTGYNVSTFTEHLLKKTLINFNDGSFCWGGEGKFFNEISNEKDRFISPLIRSIIYTRSVEGKYYIVYLTVEQTAWLTLLLLSLTAFLTRKDRTTLAVILAILGLTAFETIFEARARYLYLFVPLYIFLACTGWDAVCRKILRKGNAE